VGGEKLVVEWDWLLEELRGSKERRPFYPKGSWFWLSERVIGLAPKQGKRPVILRTPSDRPAVGVFPSTGSGGGGFPYRAHVQGPEHAKCKMTRPGVIITSIPLTVPASTLTSSAFSCIEPSEAVVARLCKSSA
jgi:hypothetical protein